MEESFGPLDALDKSELKRLAGRSDAKGLLHLAGHLGVLALSGTAVWLALGSWWLPAAWLAHGVVLIFLFAPLHECIHRTAFRSRWLNDLVATACGAILLLPATYFRCFHFAHHRFTQNPARDPELAAPKPTSWVQYLLHVSGLPYWRERSATLWRHNMGRVSEPFIPGIQRAAVAREARLHLAAYGVVALVSIGAACPTALIYWIVPALLGQPFLRMFLLAEHAGCPLVPDMMKNARTTTSNPAVRWLAWNMPFHTAHHAYPAVPFHALPAAHRHLKGRVEVTAPGYFSVQREITRAFGR
ncbi:MAG: fatty acid desaturase [Pseudomonadota bacterium]